MATITQADIDAHLAGDETEFPYPPSNEERFEAWLRLSGYDKVAEAATLSSPELRECFGKAVAEYEAWLQDNP